MTGKQIMIDGVDVSKCIFFDKNYKEDDVQIKNFCELQYISCKEFDCANCYFKKWKRKEQECEKLKEAIDGLLKIQYQLADSCTKYEQTLTEIKEIAEPYKMAIKKICGNCKKYNDCHACCYKDINCYKYTSSKTNACEEFTYLDKLVPNLLANNILQKISECEVKNERNRKDV